MCCPGCLAVAEAIVNNGLEDYYQFRTEPAQKSDDGILETLDKLKVYDDPSLHGESFTLKDHTLEPGDNPLPPISHDLFDIEMQFEPGSATEFGIRLHETAVKVSGGKVWSLGGAAPVSLIDGCVTLRILVDRTSIETFANHGEVSMTSCFLPKQEDTGLELYTKDGNVVIRSLRVTKLKSAWGPRKPTEHR